jgi:hypothetical protein
MTGAIHTVAVIITFRKCNKNALERREGASRKIKTLYNRFFSQHNIYSSRTRLNVSAIIGETSLGLNCKVQTEGPKAWELNGGE